MVKANALRRLWQRCGELRWELSLALLVKFGLLGALWWLFFAGHKVPVDAGDMARVLFNEPAAAVSAQ